MSIIRFINWKDIPVQVQAQDTSGQVSKQLDKRFQEGVDSIALLDGSSGTDDYLMGWEWGEYVEVKGNAEEEAARLADRINKAFPQDFVARLRTLHRSGERNPQPGAIDNWMD